MKSGAIFSFVTGYVSIVMIGLGTSKQNGGSQHDNGRTGISTRRRRVRS